MKINSFMSWIGGKKSSRDIIIPRFPLYYEKYVEVFGGGGWILFGKPPGNDHEIFNDFNSNISNLYSCVRDKSSELIEKLRFVLNCREDFDRIKHIISEKAEIGDVQRAAEFYQLIRYSYASSCDSFGGKPHSMWSNFPLIEQASRRLQKVVIENKDFEKLMIFSASRSRKVSIVAIIQSLAQFEKTYGKEGAEIIVDNCQCTLFGAFAPNSKTAEAMSQNLGKQTVLSGTVTRSSRRDGSNRQLQMIERPLMTVDELKSMPKGHFIVMKTGCHPMKTQLKLFFKWGIQFEDAYSIEEKSERKVQYADSKEVEAAVLERFPPKPIPVEFMKEFDRMEVEEELSRKHPPKTRKRN